MDNLFQSSTATVILDRLSKLSPDSKSKWGKMNVSQMLAHCQVPLQAALAENQPKRRLIAVLFGGIAKKFMMKEGPFRQNLPTDPGFIVKNERQFEKERQQLESLIRQFASSDTNSVAKKRHPIFGKMTAEEWGVLSWKHLDHHLRQFGE